jgi:cytochrome c
VYNTQPVSAEKLLSGFSATESNFKGKALIASSDCNSCHLVNKTAVGPSFIAIAKRYKTQNGAVDKLAKKIINGGGGSWSKIHVMSAHPQILLTDAREIVKYIFSLTDVKKADTRKNIPLNGSLALKANSEEPRGEYALVAMYTDNGGKIVGPLKGSDVIKLRSATVKAVFADTTVGFPRFKDVLTEGGNKAYILMRKVDLTGIKKFIYKFASKGMAGEIQVRIDSQAGPIISSIPYLSTGGWDKFSDLTAEITNAVKGKHDVYFIPVKHTKPNEAIIKLSTISFEQ